MAAGFFLDQQVKCELKKYSNRNKEKKIQNCKFPLWKPV